MTRALLIALIALVALVAFGATARAEPRRLALLIGATIGEPDEDRLRYAEADAERLAAALRDVGGFAAEDIVTLTTGTASDVRRVMIGLNARLRELPGDSLLFVFYSGHADAEALQLAGTRLPTAELRDLVYGSPATVRVLVIDACRSGAVTRTKGGHRGPAFAIDVDERLRSQGVAILTSSTAGEDSQESDELRASYFTHYLVSALRGAADRDADNRVTLAEAFSYAAERTLAATTRTVAGPQHPTYRFDLTGREDLVLTRPIAGGQRIGALTFGERGAYVVQQRDATGAPVAEVEVTEAGRTLALPADTYFVTRRAADHLSQGAFTVAAARTTAVHDAAMEQIAYARVVRKGGTTIRRTWSLIAAGLATSPYAEVGSGLGGMLAARLDLPAIGVELRAGGAAFAAKTPSDPKPLQGAEMAQLSAAAFRAFDLGHTTLAFGAILGGFRVTRQRGLDTTINASDELGVLVGAAGQLQHPLAGRLHARLELDALGFITQRPQDAPLAATVMWAIQLGVGVYL